MNATVVRCVLQSRPPLHWEGGLPPGAQHPPLLPRRELQLGHEALGARLVHTQLWSAAGGVPPVRRAVQRDRHPAGQNGGGLPGLAPAAVPKVQVLSHRRRLRHGAKRTPGSVHGVHSCDYSGGRRAPLYWVGIVLQSSALYCMLFSPLLHPFRHHRLPLLRARCRPGRFLLTHAHSFLHAKRKVRALALSFSLTRTRHSKGTSWTGRSFR